MYCLQFKSYLVLKNFSPKVAQLQKWYIFKNKPVATYQVLRGAKNSPSQIIWVGPDRTRYWWGYKMNLVSRRNFLILVCVSLHHISQVGFSYPFGFYYLAYSIEICTIFGIQRSVLNLQIKVGIRWVSKSLIKKCLRW